MTIRAFLEEAVCQAPDAPAQVFFQHGQWVTRSYAALKERVVRAASIVRLLEIKPGVQNVALMLENCPEWQEIYLALAGAGVAVVPLDPKLREPEVTHILCDSDAVAIFAGAKLHDVLGQSFEKSPGMRACVWVGEGESLVPTLAGRPCYAYEALMSRALSARDATRSWFEAHRPEEGTVASIIYTSGTTGRPKGAMLTHGNFTSNVAATVELVGFYPTDTFINVLPLFHSFSFTANFMLPLGIKGCCSFVRSLRTVPEDMLVLRPTVMLAVPLMAEKLYARISEKLKKNLVARGLLGIGLKSVVRKKVIESLGGKLRLLGIGGAPTSGHRRGTDLGGVDQGVSGGGGSGGGRVRVDRVFARRGLPESGLVCSRDGRARAAQHAIQTGRYGRQGRGRAVCERRQCDEGVLQEPRGHGGGVR